jgi:hypothetical protein
MVARPDSDEWRPVTAILLHKDMLRARLFNVGEDSRPVDSTLPHRRKGIGAGAGEGIGIDGDAFFHVLDVEKRKAPGEPLEIEERVLSGIGDPEDVHFHFDQSGIALGKQNVIAIRIPVPLKLADMIVISKLDACRLRNAPAFVEKRRQVPPFISRCVGGIARACVLQTQGMSLLYPWLPVVDGFWERVVGADRFEAGLAQIARGGCGREVWRPISCQFNLLVAHCRNLLQSAQRVFSVKVPNGVDLEANWARPGKPAGGDGDLTRCPACCQPRKSPFQKIASCGHQVSSINGLRKRLRPRSL